MVVRLRIKTVVTDSRDLQVAVPGERHLDLVRPQFESGESAHRVDSLILWP